MSEALMAIVATPESVLEVDGVVIKAVGALKSSGTFCTDTPTELEAPTLPAASYAFACSV